MENEQKEKNLGGRPPTILNDEEIAQVEALGAVLSIEQIADYFGISKPTFYAIMERQPEVSLRYKMGKAKAIGSVSGGLLQKARDGDNAAMIFYLKTQAGWKETTQIQQETKQVKSFSDMYGES
tara:strand:- start:187 stop:558 length:372 start_codon:yes stop_codon:yes gene_type:complete